MLFKASTTSRNLVNVTRVVNVRGEKVRAFKIKGWRFKHRGIKKISNAQNRSFIFI